MRDTSVRVKRPPRATLEIIGAPGGSVTIFPETRLDATPPPIFDGELPPSGRLRLRVPKSTLLVLASGFGKAIVQFADDEDLQQVDVSPPTI